MWEKITWYNDDTYYWDEMPYPSVITIQSLWENYRSERYF